MLISTHRVNEKLTISTNIVVTVLAVKGNRVRIGIDTLSKYQYIVEKSLCV
ncbi:carbon storage regulator [Photobacterium toruni]|uniref:carbon storage regulator n=1 Tax=Photobacterium toruni TaxID=1935446 RepID=UPI00399B10B9